MITIVLFEDNKSLRQSLTWYFNATDAVFLAGAYADANDAVDMSPTIAAKALRMFQNQFVTTQPTYVDLTEREREILTCMVRGMSYKLIADACAISFHTVHYHIKHIYEKLHVNSAPEAVVKAVEQKLV